MQCAKGISRVCVTGTLGAAHACIIRRHPDGGASSGSEHGLVEEAIDFHRCLGIICGQSAQGRLSNVSVTDRDEKVGLNVYRKKP